MVKETRDTVELSIKNEQLRRENRVYVKLINSLKESITNHQIAEANASTRIEDLEAQVQELQISLSQSEGVDDNEEKLPD